jgi:predicted HicB family RNase H-like nuclease
MGIRLYKYEGNKRKENIIRVRLDDEYTKLIKETARKKGYSLSGYIRRAIIFLLAKDL